MPDLDRRQSTIVTAVTAADVSAGHGSSDDRAHSIVISLSCCDSPLTHTSSPDRPDASGPRAAGGCCTVGIVSKLYDGGGDVVAHSSVQASQGSSPAGCPFFSDMTRFQTKIR